MAGKIQIPEELKKDLPQSNWGKILSATPIIMTVVATMLAELASSEMTKAQYDRAFAAQLQSKAGDQWSFYQAKKLRSAFAHNSFDQLAATMEIAPLTTDMLPGTSEATQGALIKGELPEAKSATFNPEITAALDAVDKSQSDEEVIALASKIDVKDLNAALIAAKDAAQTFDNSTKSINKESDKLDEGLMKGDKTVFRSFSAARLRYNATRYDNEARLNQSVANVYELLVRKYNFTAEKHHKRSGKFFMGMLAAQAAVIVSTFAIASRKRNLLWSLAATAGAVAVSFSLYVYLHV